MPPLSVPSLLETDLRPVVAATARRRLARLLVRWPAIVGALTALPLALIAVAGTLYWPGRTFPGFLLLGNAVVPTIGLYSWTGMVAAVPFHAQVIGVDGRPVRTNADVYARVASLPVGTEITYTLRKDGEVLTRRVPSMRFGAADYWLTVGLFAIFGTASIVLGVAVGLLQPRTRAARAFLVQGVLAGLFALTGSALYHPDLWWMIYPHLVTQVAFPAAFVHLGLVFPVVWRPVERQPAWLAAPYALAAVLAVWVFRDFFAVPPGLTALHVAYAWSGLSIVALVGFTIRSWVENRTPAVRPQLRSVLPGLVVGTIVGLYGFLNTARAGGDFPINLIALTPFVFYLSVAYAIARHDLFDVDTLVKQALVYAVLTGAITAAYAGAVALFTRLVPAATLETKPAVTIAFLVLVAVVFEPARRGLQAGIDRVFARGRLDYRRTVGELSAALTSLLDLDAILDRVGRTVTEGLQLRTFAVVLWTDGEAQVQRWHAASRRMIAVPPPAGLAALAGRLGERSGRPWLPFEDGEEDDPATRAVTALEAALVVPLALGGALVGAFVFGRSRSGRLFSRRDVELLQTLAAQSAIALANARSYRALETANVDLEQKVLVRTSALEQAYDALKTAQAQLVHSEKMASLGVLVAGVAHEINNPVSFIVGGVAPLREAMAEIDAFVQGQPDARLAPSVHRAQRAVDAIARGADRTAAIVKDLRTFSRHGESPARAVDVHEGIDVTLRLLQPRWEHRIAVHCAYASLPPITAVVDELNQVWMNLLANACDAIADTGNVWIRTELAAGRVVVHVRDDGSGMTPDVVGRIYDPFFTTKPPGQGTGLGLAISHGIVARHGGTIEVVSVPGQGTEFRVMLPLGGM